jgi:hypothetical protein
MATGGTGGRDDRSLARHPHRRTEAHLQSRPDRRPSQGRPFLFGPVASKPARMDVWVIATPAGLKKYLKWVASIERFIDVPPPNPRRKRNDANTFLWPGFEAVYWAVWPSRPFATCVIDAGELSRRILGADRHQAIYSAVAL